MHVMVKLDILKSISSTYHSVYLPASQPDSQLTSQRNKWIASHMLIITKMLSLQPLRKDRNSVHVNLSCLYFYCILLKLSIYSFAGFLIIGYVIPTTVLAIIT